MTPPFFSPFRWTQHTPIARLFQFFLVTVFSVWLLIPQQVWAGCACSEVAVGSDGGSTSLAVEKYYGSLTLDQVDVSLPGYAGVNLTRHYDSLQKSFGMFGYGWTSGDLNYLITTTGDIQVNMEGRTVTFAVTNNYITSDGDLQLSFNGQDEIVIESQVNEKWYFAVTNRACTKYEDRYGNATLYDMTVTNKLVGTLNGSNVWQDLPLMNQITYPDGRQMAFEYTSNLCTRVISPDGRTNDYSYTDSLLTGVSRDDGMALDYGYTTINENGTVKGWLTNMVYANGAEVNISYNGEFDTTNKLRVVEVTGPLGYDYSYGYATATDTNSSCGCRTTTTVTDSLSHDTTYTLEQNGAYKRTTNALGYVSTIFSTNGLQKSFTDNRGNTTWYVYDDANTNTMAKSNLLVLTNTLGKAWNYGYDSNNQKIREISPLNQTNQYKYDNGGRLVSVTNALGIQIFSKNYADNGLLASFTGARGYSTTNMYDSYGLLTNQVDALTNSWKNTYNDSGNLISATDPLGATDLFSYNEFYKVKSITNSYGYVTLFSYDEMANLTNTVDASGNSTSLLYDQLQRIVKIKNGLGYETKFNYDAESNLKVISNALNCAYSYTYDSVNQVKESRYPDGSTESYGYDANGNLTVTTNRSGQVIKLVYDAGNRLVSRTYQGATNTIFNFTYDDADRLISILRSSGGLIESAITNDYDRVDRMISQNQGSYTLRYAYDSSDNATNIIYPSGINIVRNYDALDRISSICDSTNINQLASYTYDGLDNLLSRTIENGTECVYSYDKIGQMTNLTLRTASMPTNILQSFTYGYDVVGNRIWSKYKNGRGDVYAYDATYQIVGVKYNVTDPTVGYASAANPSKTVVYSYDALGNRTTVIEGTATNTYSINNLNLYTTNGAVAYTHDGRGNIAGDGTWTFGYDYKNHLTSANKTGMAITYAYDGMGRRLNKVVNGVKTSYIYDGMNLIEQRDGSGAVIATYIYESGIDCPLKATIGVNTYYFQRDVIGNVTALISSSGNIQEQYEYDIFGNPTIKDGSGNILSVSATPFLFTGREYDVETGLYHYRARAYSPVLGRFLQVDPIDFEGGDVNTYRYCANNPINGTDALGLLNSAQALAHYLGGSGTPLSMKFADIGGTSKVKASGFTQVKGFISKTKKIRGKCCPKTEKVDDHKAYSTSGDQALFLGNITLHLTGTWSVNEKCHWNFSGDLGAFDDTYDFNPSTHRSKTAEFLTGVGAKLPGKKYTISFTGKNSSSEDGDIK